MNLPVNTKYLSAWQGFIPPQYIFANRRFRCVALDPPDFKPGSWIGAGKAIFDWQTEQFLLTARPRKVEGKARGFAANIYQSKNGENFELVTSTSKEVVAEKSGLKIHSIEGTQILKDPRSGKWHFYLSVDTGPEFIWGGLYWETLLLTALRLEGPWRSEGLVLRHDQSYDSNQSRDATIDIVDGRWLCLYKAVNGKQERRPALATSSDGISWRKHGPLTVDSNDYCAFLSGTIFASSSGPLFVGVEKKQDDFGPVPPASKVVYADKYKIGHGEQSTYFAAYSLDYRNNNLETIFRSPWKPLSEYEHQRYPLLGYASLVYDPFNHRMLNYVEAIDKSVNRAGLNESIERVLVYETALKNL